MANKPLVVYHGPGCLDGMGAAWCMYQLFKEDAEYVVGRYQSEDKIDFADRDVYLVDFSYKRDELEERVLPFANNVYLIDHHKTALDELWDLPFGRDNFFLCNSTTEHSGARLAWDFVTERMGLNISIPPIIAHIEDRDLWKFTHPDTKAITAALFSHELDFRSIDNFMCLEKGKDMEELAYEGRALLRAHDKDCQVLLKIARRTMFLEPPTGEPGEHCIVIDMVNAPPMYSSDIGNLIALENGLGGTYYDSEKHREFSLRSVGDIDVSAIAKMFGGGGHKNAAGFKVLRDSPLAKL